MPRSRPGHRRNFLMAALTLVGVASCGGGEDEGPSDTPSVFFSDAVSSGPAPGPEQQVIPVDYSDPSSWLCLPGRGDSCEADASVTLVAPDGSLEVTPAVTDAEAAIDCFYVYPTVSDDAAANSDIAPGPGELNAASNQAAPFSQACRVYAPMYRQVTLAALRTMLAGGASMTNRDMAYIDVRAAWRAYLDTHNDGRGVVLIGHSQGAGLLARLIASEIAPSEQRELVVSALLIGANLSQPQARPGQDELPICDSAGATGCLIAYGSYRADRPPGADAIFGALPDGEEAACVNPARLDGSNGALDARLPVGQAFETALAPPAWAEGAPEIETPLVGLPGMLSAECVSSGGRSFLAVTVVTDPYDRRVDDIVGDVVVDGVVQDGWGLHIIDVNLALGNLVSIVERQSEAWLDANVADRPVPAGADSGDGEDADPG